MSVTSEERIRCIVILCCHCLRNIAFYRAGWKRQELRIQRQFWVNANANFLDVACLEWSKLFADSNGKHHWKRIVGDQPFSSGLFDKVKMDQKEFKSYIKLVLRYRNKFVAHLDEDKVANIPHLRTALRSAAYLYDYLRDDPTAKQHIPEVKHSAAEFYAKQYRHVYQEYQFKD